MKIRAALLSLTAITFLGASSFASTYSSSYAAHPGYIRHAPGVVPHDGIVYSNGPDDGLNAYTISNVYVVSNSFDLATEVSLTSVSFSNWFFHGDTGSQVTWAITTELNAGTVLASGTAALTGVFQGTNGLGADVYLQTFALGVLGPMLPGTYYLQLSDEVVSFGDPGFWGESGGPSIACQGDGASPCDVSSSIPSESFFISGGDEPPPPPIPEPSSLVLFGTGLLGAAGALRRKFSV